MDLILLAALLITGFVGCAEFASVALVHPVVRRLPLEAQLAMEKGLLRTFGRIMPIGMTAAAVSGGVSAFRWDAPWFSAAAAVLTLALLVTILGNVPINRWTARLPTDAVPEGFRLRRRRWDLFQAVRGSLQLLGFVLISLVAASLP